MVTIYNGEKKSLVVGKGNFYMEKVDLCTAQIKEDYLMLRERRSLLCSEKEGLSHTQRKDVYLMLCHNFKFTLGFGVYTGLTQSLNICVRTRK